MGFPPRIPDLGDALDRDSDLLKNCSLHDPTEFLVKIIQSVTIQYIGISFRIRISVVCPVVTGFAELLAEYTSFSKK